MLRLCRLFVICLLLACSTAFTFLLCVDALGSPSGEHWYTPIAPNDGAYYFPASAGGAKVHVVWVDMNSGQWQLRPVFCRSITHTSTIAAHLGASAAVNGGFFNLSTGQAAGYVVIDGVQAKDPSTHSTGSKSHKDPSAAYKEQIANRSELRILTGCFGRVTVEIARHNDALPAGCKLLHCLQAGPQLLPAVTTVEEAFVRRDPRGRYLDVISSTSRTSRTAVGITAAGQVLLVAVDGPEQGVNSSGLTITELSVVMKNLGCTSALNLDGGHSTTMSVKLNHTANGASAGKTAVLRVVSSSSPERKVKTQLVLMPVGR